MATTGSRSRGPDSLLDEMTTSVFFITLFFNTFNHPCLLRLYHNYRRNHFQSPLSAATIS
jgi:hypothetical protein